MDAIIKLGKIDRRIIYIFMTVLILIPLVKPIGLPVSVSSWTRQTYETLDKLKAGDKIIVDFYYAPSGMADVHPQTVAVFQHLLGKGVKILCVAFTDQGASIADELLRSWEAKGKKYGEDFVNLGYLTGGETAMAAFIRDMTRAIPVDFRKNPTANLPIMKGVNNGGDVQALMYFTSSLLPETWVRQAGQYKIPILGGVITVMGPQAEPFLQSKQLAGVLVGMRCGAEYEVISKTPGPALAAMDAQSMGHLIIILFIIFGNIAYFAERSQSRRNRV
jgi:hypothetical protein